MNFIINCIDVLKFGMDGEMETLKTMFVPLDFLNAVVYPSISKPIEEVWDNIVVHDVEKAKDNGINGIYRLVSSEDFNREKLEEELADIFCFGLLLADKHNLNVTQCTWERSSGVSEGERTSLTAHRPTVYM